MDIDEIMVLVEHCHFYTDHICSVVLAVELQSDAETKTIIMLHSH